MHRISRRFVALLGALVLGLGLAAPANAQSCDRACLRGLLTTYIDALVAKDPSRLPLASSTIKVTEDSMDIKLGEGIWQTVTGKTSFRQDYIDTARQVAAAHVELREGSQPALTTIVLHVEGGKIAGIETQVQHIGPTDRMQPRELGAPIRGFPDPVPPGEKMNRGSMVEIALTYTEGLRVGSFTDGGTPFSAETYRVENGMILAGEGCGRGDCGMYAQRIIVHPGILASVVAVDEVEGTVLLWMNFGDTGSYGEDSALVAYEAFKIWGNQIHSILAFFKTQHANTPRYWPSEDPFPHVY